MTVLPNFQYYELWLTSHSIRSAVSRLAREIEEDYCDANHLVLLGVLKGSFIFLADLIRELDIPTKIEFITLSSYERNKQAVGPIRVWSEPSKRHLEEEDILIVEDIVDTGETIKFLKSRLLDSNPDSVKVCTLLQRSTSKIQADYIGFHLEREEYVVGYGLDDKNFFRDLPDIYILKEEK